MAKKTVRVPEPDTLALLQEIIRDLMETIKGLNGVIAILRTPTNVMGGGYTPIPNLPPFVPQPFPIPTTGDFIPPWGTVICGGTNTIQAEGGEFQAYNTSGTHGVCRGNQ